MNELVSVIVPTYNRAYCICRAIESVRNQTYPNWEVIIVDDGSTDETPSLIASTYGNEPRVKYLRQKNGGVSAARNTGIRAAVGDYVALLDSDDIWKPWKLEVQLDCFREFPQIGMVWTDFEAVDAAGDIVKPRYLRTMYEAYRFYPKSSSLFASSRSLAGVTRAANLPETDAGVYVGNIYTAMLRGSLVHTSTVMLSRDRIEKVKGFDETLTLSGEDYDFHFRTCKWGDVCFVDLPSTIYQLDFEDRLTRHKKQIAFNFLRTVESAIARERGTAQFPPAMISEVLSEAHAWIAEELFKVKDNAGVRRHAVQSLRRHPWQPRLIGMLGVSMVPRTLTEPALNAYRSAKSGLTGSGRS